MTAYRSKGTVSEDEVYALVQRYGASTIFTLLQEVSQATEKDVTMDWRTLVKATSTGISNAQEYQMLWRHLAYRDPLEKIEDGGEPLSDESDLEFELEATPNHSEEISTEVDCCVKRWSIIRKRQTSSKQSNGSKARSEEMLAAQKAFSMAINMPMSGSLSTILSGGTHMQTANSSASIAGGTSGALDESPACASQAFKPNQPINLETSSQKVPPNPSNKPRTAQKKPPSAQLKPAICPNPLIKAAAFAAGGRIATPLTAASLFKAAQSVNAVRIRHAGSSSLIGSSVTGTISSSSTTAATTTAATAPITGSHTPNSKFSHPSSGLTTSKLCQVQQGSGKAPLQQLSSESRLGVMTSCGRNENGKRRRSVNNSAVDVDQLLVEEAVAEPDDEASDKLVQDTKNGSSDRKIEENQCTETEETTSKNLKEEQSGEGKGRIVEVISPNSGDSQLEEEVILHS
ncbi:uncharacterized protein LOC110116224 isoform X2 [Dendrobium catenatum]|uniref:uncharacterized protein LOC110116224 isoform X2 n=1 Tax=Dendrobium catenatum TaxID=906689 RepID=UPI0009F413B3|nr:uncharacterized protein LOC110116224 isoform X2 [Dendrobium catenatum]